MVHVPTATRVTVAPESVHTADVSDAKLTVRPDDDVALTVNGAVPNTSLESAPNVIVWLVCVTWKL
jgi:hypothetical protein